MSSNTVDKGKGKAKLIDFIEPIDKSTQKPYAKSQITTIANHPDETSAIHIVEEQTEIMETAILLSGSDEEQANTEDTELHEAGTPAHPSESNEEEEITLADDTLPPIPKLQTPNLPRPYLQVRSRRDGGFAGPSTLRDPDIELAEKMISSFSVPAPPLPPPELSKSGGTLTKKEKKEMTRKTAGPDWFDLPAPAAADLPRLYREVEALRLRNQLDPKRFYKKEEGEGKGIKGLPKFFAIGKVLPSTTPFGTPSGDNLPRAQRKRTLVDELVDDAEAKRYAKKKFDELQSVRGAKGKNTLHAKQAMRRSKW